MCEVKQRMAFLEEEVMICLRSHAEIALDQGKVIDSTFSQYSCLTPSLTQFHVKKK